MSARSDRDLGPWERHLSESADRIWPEALRDLAHRNGTVEAGVAFDGEPAEALPIYRCRLLVIEADGSLVIERSDRAVIGHFQEGILIDVMMSAGPQRWRARCRALGIEEFALNPTTQVPAIRLCPALEVVSGQRRDLFRVNT